MAIDNATTSSNMTANEAAELMRRAQIGGVTFSSDGTKMFTSYYKKSINTQRA